MFVLVQVSTATFFCIELSPANTFVGQCHLGRIDHEVRFDPAFKERLFMSSRDYEWFMPVHSLIDSVQEFRDNGIPLFRFVTDIFALEKLRSAYNATKLYYN